MEQQKAYQASQPQPSRISADSGEVHLIETQAEKLDVYLELRKVTHYEGLKELSDLLRTVQAEAIRRKSECQVIIIFNDKGIMRHGFEQYGITFSKP